MTVIDGHATSSLAPLLLTVGTSATVERSARGVLMWIGALTLLALCSNVSRIVIVDRRGLFDGLRACVALRHP
ncbi:hypothetical protein [Mycobacterium talmoniae]|uniref:hypothetical protein n=1 Tax=Mycobacterium talmoniae TaxID=1858794 RepID=UPI0010589F39|nr:hypothetical protein [Mycobacterium talmoniae]